MDSFKKFIKKITTNTDLGAPFQVSQGEHSKKIRRKLSLGTPFRVSQGEHSRTKDDKLKENVETKPLHPPFEFFQSMGNPNPVDGPKPNMFTKVMDHIKSNTSNVYEDVRPFEKTQADLHNHYSIVENPHFRHIRTYTRDSSGINSHLFDHHAKHNDPSYPVSSEYVHQIQGMDSALSHKGLHRSLKVFSGLKKNPGLIMGDNKRMYHPSYMSTTIKPDITLSFAERLSPNTNDSRQDIRSPFDQHFLVAHLTPGQHGFYVGSHSEFDHEHEFIMPRRTIFHVHDHEVHDAEHPFKRDAACKLHFWHASVINPDGKI